MSNGRFYFDENNPVVIGHLDANRSDGDEVYVVLRPGLTLQIKTDDIAKREDTYDSISGRDLVHLKLHPDVEIRSVLQAKLARIAYLADHEHKGDGTLRAFTW